MFDPRIHLNLYEIVEIVPIVQRLRFPYNKYQLEQSMRANIRVGRPL